MTEFYQYDLTSVKLKSSAGVYGAGNHMALRGVAMDARNPKRMNDGRNFVRQWRLHRKLTQEQLAELTGYSASSISQLETGAQGYEEATLVKLSEALKCHPGDLISGPPAEIHLLHELRELDSERRDEVVAMLSNTLAHLKKLGHLK